MKIILLLFVLGTMVGMRANRLGWREIGVIAGAVALIVGWETANILFRYIGVE